METLPIKHKSQLCVTCQVNVLVRCLLPIYAVYQAIVGSLLPPEGLGPKTPAGTLQVVQTTVVGVVSSHNDHKEQQLSIPHYTTYFDKSHKSEIYAFLEIFSVLQNSFCLARKKTNCLVWQMQACCSLQSL